MDMFEQDEFTIEYTPTFDDTSANQTYSEVVKDLIMDEKQYLRDLQVRKFWWFSWRLQAAFAPIFFCQKIQSQTVIKKSWKEHAFEIYAHKMQLTLRFH